MLTFHMTDIIPLLDIPYPPSGRISYDIPCPCCDSGRKKHLNINLKKNVFRCPKCGFSGGVFDLYSYYSGIAREDAREDIKSRLGYSNQPALNSRTSKKKARQIVVPEIDEYAPTDVDTRDKTYRALLELLTLASDHKDNLMNRGLSEAAIEKNNYKTTPLVGSKTIAKKLREAGHDLAGVPGFYRNKEGEWTFINNQRGILIPVRDSKNRIQGMQIRRDNVKRRKFRWVASPDLPDGCRSKGWVHIVGPTTKSIILIEGPLKADIVHHLTGFTVVAVPGVNTLTQLEKVLLQLRDKGVERIMTAFDMDFLANPHVQNGYTNLLNMIASYGFSYGTYLWHPEYNGLDDYIWECLMHELLVS